MKRILSIVFVLVLASSATAVTPAVWTHTTEAHFAAGKHTATVTTSLGQLLLARKTEILMPSEGAPAVVSAVAVANSTIYAASGTDGRVYRIVRGKAEKIATLPCTVVNSLLWVPGERRDRLLAGGGGEKAGIYEVANTGKPKLIWSDEKVKYVWAMLPGPQGDLYVATGPAAAVYAVDTGGKGRLLYQADGLAKNILCLASAHGKLYAGTDEKGLVIEIDPWPRPGALSSTRPRRRSPPWWPGPTACSPPRAMLPTPAPTEAFRPTGPKRARPLPPPSTKKAATTKPEAPAATGEDAAKPEPPATKKRPKRRPSRGRAASSDPDEPAVEPVVPSRPPAGDSATKAPTPKTPALTAKPQPAKAGPRPAAPAGPKPAPTPRSPSPASRPSAPTRGAPSRPTPTSSGPGGPGNAIYHIAADGLVQTIFRKPVTILAMVRQGEKLLLATGNGGAVYSVSLDGDEVVKLVDTDAKQATALVPEARGNVIFATANAGSVGRIAAGYAQKGTFISPAMDAKQIAKWGSAVGEALAPAGTKVTIATRSGNLAEADEKTWSSWSKDVPLGGGFLPVGSPNARLLQYRLTLTSKSRATPKVDRVEIVYQMGNLPPVVPGVMVQASAKGPANPQGVGGKFYRHVMAKAGDPNGDKLAFHIAFRRAGSEAWIELAKDLPQPKYSWDTRNLGDGVYYLRFTASDAPTNPPALAREASRRSEPVVVDNTAPIVRGLAANADGRAIHVKGSAVDASSRLIGLQYSIDSQNKWQAVLPTDGICDTNREDFTIDIKDAKPGLHRIAVKAVDLYGNTGYGSVEIVVK